MTLTSAAPLRPRPGRGRYGSRSATGRPGSPMAKSRGRNGSPAGSPSTRSCSRWPLSYGVRVADLVRPTRRPSEARPVALYGLRRWAGQALAAIAGRMKGGKGDILLFC